MVPEVLFWKRPKPRPGEQISSILRPGPGPGSLPDNRSGRRNSVPGSGDGKRARPSAGKKG